jgi:tRNA A37 methylthiotransferase MiaB
MNDADATTVRGGLGEMGFSPTSDRRAADLVVLITCVVRQRAEDNGIEFGCPAKRATIDLFSRILVSGTRSNSLRASRVICSELLSGHIGLLKRSEG